MAAENDFFLRFGTNADEWAKRVDEGAREAISSMSDLEVAVEQLNAKLDQSPAAGMLESLQGDIRSISQELANTFGSELQQALQSTLDRLDLKVNVEPTVTEPKTTESKYREAVERSESKSASSATPSELISDMRQFGRDMSEAVTSELRGALAANLPDAIREGVRSASSALDTPEDVRTQAAAEKKTGPSKAPEREIDRVLQGIPERFREVAEQFYPIMEDLIARVQAKKVELGVSETTGRRSGSAGEIDDDTDIASAALHESAEELSEALDAVAGRVDQAGEGVAESLTGAQDQLTRLRAVIQQAEQIWSGLKEGDPTAAMQASQAVTTERKGALVRTRAEGGGGLSAEAAASITEAADRQEIAANEMTDAVNQFGLHVGELGSLLGNIQVTLDTSQIREHPLEASAPEAPEPQKAPERPHPAEVGEQHATAEEIQKFQQNLMELQQALDLLGEKISHATPEDYRKISREPDVKQARETLDRIVGPEGRKEAVKSFRKGASVEDVDERMVQILEQRQKEQAGGPSAATVQALEQSMGEVTEENNATAQAMGAHRNAVDQGAKAAAEAVEGHQETVATTAEMNKAHRLATEHMRKIQTLISSEVPEGVADVSKFDEPTRPRGEMEVGHFREVFEAEAFGGLDQEKILGQAAENMNLQEPMRSLVMNVTDQMRKEAAQALREAGQSTMPSIGRGAAPARTMVTTTSEGIDPRVKMHGAVAEAAALRGATRTHGDQAGLIEQIERSGDVTPSTKEARQRFETLLDQFFQVLEMALPADQAQAIRGEVEAAQAQAAETGASRQPIFEALEPAFEGVRLRAQQVEERLARDPLPAAEMEQVGQIAGMERGQRSQVIMTLTREIARLNGILHQQTMGTGNIVVPPKTARPATIYSREADPDAREFRPGSMEPDFQGDVERAGIDDNMEIINAAELKAQALSDAAAQLAQDLNMSVEALDKVVVKTSEEKYILQLTRQKLDELDTALVDRITEVVNQVTGGGVSPADPIPVRQYGTPPSPADPDLSRREQARQPKPSVGVTSAEVLMRNEAMEREAERARLAQEAQRRIQTRMEVSGRHDVGGDPLAIRRGGLRQMAERMVLPMDRSIRGRDEDVGESVRIRELPEPQKGKGGVTHGVGATIQDRVMQAFSGDAEAGRAVIDAWNQLATRAVDLNEKVLLRGEAESVAAGHEAVDEFNRDLMRRAQEAEERGDAPEAERLRGMRQEVSDKERRDVERVLNSTADAGERLQAVLDKMFRAPDAMAEPEAFHAQRGRSMEELVFGGQGIRRFEAEMKEEPDARVTSELEARRRARAGLAEAAGVDLSEFEPTQIAEMDRAIAAALNPEDIDEGLQQLSRVIIEATNKAGEQFDQQQQAHQARVSEEELMADVLGRLRERLERIGEPATVERGREVLRTDQPAKEHLRRQAMLRPAIEQKDVVRRMAHGAPVEGDVDAAFDLFAGEDPEQRIGRMAGLIDKMSGVDLGNLSQAALEAEQAEERRAAQQRKVAELQDKITSSSQGLTNEADVEDLQKAENKLRELNREGIKANQVFDEMAQKWHAFAEQSPEAARLRMLEESEVEDIVTDPRGIEESPELVAALEEFSRAAHEWIQHETRQEGVHVQRVGQRSGLSQKQMSDEGVTSMRSLFEALRRLEGSADQAAAAQAALATQLPEVQEGMVRLWRGEGTEHRDLPEGMGEVAESQRGRYFTPDRELAEQYMPEGGRLKYIDVPEDVAAAHGPSGDPWAALSDFIADRQEVILPQEFADQARDVDEVLAEGARRAAEALEEGGRRAADTPEARARLGEPTTMRIPQTESERIRLFDFLEGESAGAVPGVGGKDVLNQSLERTMELAQQLQGLTPLEAMERGIVKTEHGYTRIQNQLAALAEEARVLGPPDVHGEAQAAQGWEFASPSQRKKMGAPKGEALGQITPSLVSAAQDSVEAARHALVEDMDVSGARTRAIEGKTNERLIDVLSQLVEAMGRLGDCCDQMGKAGGGGGWREGSERRPRGVPMASDEQLRNMLAGELNKSVMEAVARGRPSEAAMEVMSDPNIGQALSQQQIIAAISQVAQQQGAPLTGDQQQAATREIISAQRMRGVSEQAFEKFAEGDVQGTGEALVRASGDVDTSLQQLVHAFGLSSEDAEALRASLEALQASLKSTGEDAESLAQKEKDRIKAEANAETPEQRLRRKLRGQEVSSRFEVDPEDPAATAEAVGRDIISRQIEAGGEPGILNTFQQLTALFPQLDEAAQAHLAGQLEQIAATEQSEKAIRDQAAAEEQRAARIKEVRELLPQQMRERFDKGELSTRQVTDAIDVQSGRRGETPVGMRRQLEGLFEGEDIGDRGRQAVDTYIDQAKQGIRDQRTGFQRLMGTMFGGRGSLLERTTRTVGNFIARYIGGALVFGLASQIREMTSQAMETEQTFVRITSALEATQRSASGVRTELQNIAIDTNVAVNDTYEVMAQLVGVFETTEETLKATEVVNRLELISQGALSARQGFTALTAVTAAFHEELQETRGMTDLEAIDYVADVATRIQDLTGVNIEDTTEGLARLGETARTLGIDMEMVAASTALTVKATGQSGQVASEQMGRIFAQFQNADAQDLLVSLGITDQAKIQAGEFGMVFEDLLRNYQALESSEKRQVANVLGDPRQFALTNAMLNQGAEAINVYEQSLGSSGAAAERQDQILGTLRGQIGQLGKELSVIVQNLYELGALNVFQALLLPLGKILEYTVKFLQFVKELKDNNWLINWTVQIGMFIAGLKVAHAAIKAMGVDMSRMMGTTDGDARPSSFRERLFGPPQEKPEKVPWSERTRQRAEARGVGEDVSIRDAWRRGRDRAPAAASTGDPALDVAKRARAEAERNAANAADMFGGGLDEQVEIINRNMAAHQVNTAATYKASAAQTAGAANEAAATQTKRANAAQWARNTVEKIKNTVAAKQLTAALRMTAQTAGAAASTLGTGAVNAGKGLLNFLRGPGGLLMAGFALSGFVTWLHRSTAELREASDAWAEQRRNAATRREAHESGLEEEDIQQRNLFEESRDLSLRQRMSESARHMFSSPGNFVRQVGGALTPWSDSRSQAAMAGEVPEETQATLDKYFNEILEARDSGDVEAASDVQKRLEAEAADLLDSASTEAQRWEIIRQIEGQEKLQETVIRAIVDANLGIDSAWDFTQNNIDQMMDSFGYLQGLDASAMARYGDSIAMIIETTADLPEEAERRLRQMAGSSMSSSDRLSAMDEVLDLAEEEQRREIEQIKGGDNDPEKIAAANQQLRQIIQQRMQLDEQIIAELTNLPMTRAEIERAFGNFGEAERLLRNAAREFKNIAARADAGSQEEADAIKGYLDAVKQAAEDSIAETIHALEMAAIETQDPLAKVQNDLQQSRTRMEAYANTPGMAEEVRQEMQNIVQLQRQIADEHNSIADAYDSFMGSLSRNPVIQANHNYATAMRRYQRAIDQDMGLAEVLASAQAVEEAAQAQRDAAEEIRAAQAQLDIAQIPRGATLSTAMENLKESFAAQRHIIREFGRESAEYRNSVAAMIEEKQGLEDAIRALHDAHSSVAVALANAAGLDIRSAELELDQARRELDRALKDAGGDWNETGVREAYAQVISREAALRDSVFNRAVGTIDFMLEMDDITANQAIAALQAIGQTMDLTEDQQRQLRRQIKQLQDSLSDSLSGGFNIADVRLPTPYEVRRSLGIDRITEGVEEGRGILEGLFEKHHPGSTKGAEAGGVLDVILDPELVEQIRSVGKGVDNLLPPISEIPSVIEAQLQTRDDVVAKAEEQFKQLVAMEESNNATVTDASERNSEMLDKVEAAIEKAGFIVDDKGNLINTSLGELQEEAAALLEKGNNYLETSNESLGGILSTVQGIRDDMEAAREEERRRKEQEAESGGGWWQRTFDNITGRIMGALEDPAAVARTGIQVLNTFQSLMRVWGASGSSSGSNWTPASYGTRRLGGDVHEDKPYLVGERGPELFIPETSGSIVKSAEMSSFRPASTYSPSGGMPIGWGPSQSGSDIINYVNITVHAETNADPAQIATAVEKKVTSSLRRSLNSNQSTPHLVRMRR